MAAPNRATERRTRSGPNEKTSAIGGQPNSATGTDRDARVTLFVSLIQHGESVRKAARRSGLSPDQVLQWLEEDPTVAAEMDLARGVIRTQVHFRLIALAHKAVDAVDQAIEDGDARIAVDVLHGLGLMGERSEEPG